MTGALEHRGPDASGVWYDERTGVGLGHRRLSILDLSEHGAQPMVSGDGRWVLAYNGEVYSAPTLGAELSAQTGLRLRGHSDTEVLLEAIARWGLGAALERAIGMFAIAAFDTHANKLYLVRDRLGIKPLYYGRHGRTLLFGSELKALRAYDGFSPDLDRGALAGFMRYGVMPGARSIYQGVQKVRPGSYVTFDADGRETETVFWSAAEVVARGRGNGRQRSFEETTDELEALLRTAIRDRLLSDVPLGAFLSGGIDSSTVVALMQRESSGPVRTFTIGFEDPAYDESGSARAVAEALGTDHTELIVSAERARATIPRLATIFDEPFADSSQIPTMLVSELARRHVTVALSGDGGDELFGGYNRHLWAPRFWSTAVRIPLLLRTPLAALLEGVPPWAWDRVYRGVEPVLPSALRARLPGDKLHKLARLLRARSSSDAYRGVCSQWTRPSSLVIGDQGEAPPWAVSCETLMSFAERMMLLDLLNYLPDDILTKVDRASMAVALEARVPILDHRVVEFAWSLPLDFRVRDGVGKAPLRQILKRHVPEALVDRPKMGFGIPIGTWLRGPLRAWAEELIEPGRVRREGWLHPAPIRGLWERHLSGRVNAEHALWPVLVFQAWLERWRP